MTYMIDGRRITRRTRPELLTLVERIHSSIPAEIAAGYHNGYANGAAALELVTAQRDQAVAELDTQRVIAEKMQEEFEEAVDIGARRLRELHEANASIDDLSGDLSFVRAELAASRKREMTIHSRLLWLGVGAAIVEAGWAAALWLA